MPPEVPLCIGYCTGCWYRPKEGIYRLHDLILACVYGGPLSIGHLRFCKYLHTWVGFGIDIFHTVYRGYCWYKPNRGTLMLWAVKICNSQERSGSDFPQTDKFAG